VTEHYDTFTKDYLAATGEFIQFFRTLDTDALMDYVATAAGIEDGMRVLDAGCGVGAPSIWLAQRFPQLKIDAVTISPVQAEIALARVAQAGLADRITIHQGDFHHLAELFPAHIYDRVLFLESLGHSADQVRVMRGVSQLLVHGGQVYIKDFFRLSDDDPATAAKIEAAIDVINRTYHYHVMGLGALIDAIVAAKLMPCLLQPPAMVADVAVAAAFEDRTGRLTYPAFTSTYSLEWYEVGARRP
jgi:ubiquinone/menaquinone biosynthesis C-methylase UbiE